MDFPKYTYHSFNGLGMNKPIKTGVESKKEINPLKCKDCDFIGKNDKSIRFHIIKKHVGKINS